MLLNLTHIGRWVPRIRCAIFLHCLGLNSPTGLETLEQRVRLCAWENPMPNTFSRRQRNSTQENDMKPKRITVLGVASLLVLTGSTVATAQDQPKKVDPTGTWKSSITTPTGDTREATLVLKCDGDKLTGTISGRRGDTPITNASLKGNEISFEVIREFGENRFTNKYSGKIVGDTIKGKMEFVDRQGQQQTRDWEAKRETAKPAEEAKPKPTEP